MFLSIYKSQQFAYLNSCSSVSANVLNFIERISEIIAGISQVLHFTCEYSIRSGSKGLLLQVTQISLNDSLKKKKI